jgi:hypothetical protein
MVKKYIPKKSTKKIKKLKFVKNKPQKVEKAKRVKFKKIQQNNLYQKIPKISDKNEEINNIFLEAQSAIKILCCVCNKNITNQIKVILESTNPKNKIYQKGLNFNALCLKCFLLKTKYNSKENIYYVGNEITLYNFKFSSYSILNKMSENIFTNDWTLGDEIKLLGAIEKLGLENWEEISKILGKGKFECESHYYTFYYKSKDDYLPSEKIININNLNKNNNNSKNLLKINKKEENKYLLKIQENIGYIPFSDNNKPNRSISKNIKKDDQDLNKPINQNIYDNLGYWVKRKDYDVEFKNEAEIELSELEFKDEDSMEQIKNNFKCLKNYNNVLDEREERKKLVEEKNLFDVRKQINYDKKLSNQDREIYQSIKYNLKYLTREQFLFLFESNILEKNLKARLNQLLFYQKLGCNTYDDIQKYINEIKKENIKKKEEKNEKEDEKMKLRTSTIISTNKLSEIYKKNKKQKKDNKKDKKK